MFPVFHRAEGEGQASPICLLLPVRLTLPHYPEGKKQGKGLGEVLPLSIKAFISCCTVNKWAHFEISHIAEKVWEKEAREIFESQSWTQLEIWATTIVQKDDGSHLGKECLQIRDTYFYENALKFSF